jgi:hypothetical protein
MSPLRRSAIVALLCLPILGCGRSVVSIDNPIAVAPDEYQRVLTASVNTLRDMRFVVNRVDERFGVVTTYPMTASSFFEPWHVDNTTPDQVVENTINHQRRIARVTLEPIDRQGQVLDLMMPRSPAQAPASYQLRVEVMLERRQTPERQLNTAAVAGLQFAGAAGTPRALMTEYGEQEVHWRPVGRDELIEQRLVAEILQRAAELPVASAEPADLQNAAVPPAVQSAADDGPADDVADASSASPS